MLKINDDYTYEINPVEIADAVARAEPGQLDNIDPRVLRAINDLMVLALPAEARLAYLDELARELGFIDAVDLVDHIYDEKTKGGTKPKPAIVIGSAGRLMK